MAISREQIMAAKQVSMSEVLSSLGVSGKHKKYCCPFHNDQHPSSAITNNNLLWCFVCGKGFDTISVVQQLVGVSFNEAINYLATVKLQSPAPADQVVKESIKTAEENYIETLKCFRPYNAHLRPSTKALLEEHLEGRKLHNAIKNLEVNGYSIGFTPYGREKQITYRLNDFFIKRGLDGNKYIMGNVKITPLKVNTSNTYVIVEGITDALAIAEMGYNALSLNGVGNTGLLTELILEHEALRGYHYIIGTDNDKAGLKGRDELMKFFIQHNINCSDFQELRKHPEIKDCGELHIKCYQ